MEIRITQDAVEIEGYVNAVERKSKPLWSRIGQFVERICAGAFKRALERTNNVKLLLNHDMNRELANTDDGSLTLKEDNIGLHARAIIRDKEVIQKAKDGKLIGWSFGFYDRDVEDKKDENGLPLREVRDLDLEEVSILDDTKIPAYDGTLVAVRAESDKTVYFGETFADEINIREVEQKDAEPKHEETHEVNKPNYDEWDSLIEDMKN